MISYTHVYEVFSSNTFETKGIHSKKSVKHSTNELPMCSLWMDKTTPGIYAYIRHDTINTYDFPSGTLIGIADCGSKIS